MVSCVKHIFAWSISLNIILNNNNHLAAILKDCLWFRYVYILLLDNDIHFKEFQIENEFENFHLSHCLFLK